MKKSLFFFSILAISFLTFAQQTTKDMSQAPTNFNNQEYTYGDPLDGALSSFSESFEGTTFPPAGWIKANPDGGTGWDRITVGTTPIPGWNGGVITAPAGGGNAVAYCTWTTGGAVGNDQWLITPQVSDVQSGDMLTFWMQVPGYTNQSYLDQIDIKISTTGTNVANFTTLVEALVFPAGSPDTNWIQYSYTLTDYVSAGSNIYIGFQEHVADNINDGAAILLDLVEVTQGGGGMTFFEDFEGFIAGQQLACQDPVNWTTWSDAPCGNEDALISTNYAYSGTNSFLVDAVAPRAVDIVKPFGDLTSGVWYLDFMAYVPTGKFGYFNVMATFAPPTYVWAMQAYFNAGGSGSIDAGASNAAQFTFPHDTWFPVSVVVDLNTDQAQLSVNGVFVYQWQYTLGTFGNGCPLVLAATDMFGPDATASNNVMYVDDYRFSDMPVPVELTSFTANASDGKVMLSWITASEINNQGFEVERRTESSEFRTIGFVEGKGTTTEQNSYSFLDKTVEQGVTYYRLKQIDFNGSYEYSSEVAVDATGPLSFELTQNYPNPFNPTTNIKFSVPEAGNVKLSVYNLVGEEVAVLVNGFSQPGTFEVTFDASNLSTGVYLYKLQSANSVQTKKMMLLK